MCTSYLEQINLISFCSSVKDLQFNNCFQRIGVFIGRRGGIYTGVILIPDLWSNGCLDVEFEYSF